MSKRKITHKRPNRMDWLNWHWNRNRIGMYASYEAHSEYMRRVSWRRVL